MSQKQISPDSKKGETQPPETKKKPATAPSKSDNTIVPTIPKGSKTKEDIDKLLDEMDDILEENAEEFVRNYVQRGGE